MPRQTWPKPWLARRVRPFLEALEDRTLLSAPAPVDDFPDSADPPPTILLDSTGAGVQMGTIEVESDFDAFQFVAPVTGKMIVRQTPAFGSTLDGHIAIWQGSPTQVVLATYLDNDDVVPGLSSSLLVFDVTAGEPYVVGVASSSESTGGYVLSFSSFAEPRPLDLDGSGFGRYQGVLSQPGHGEMFQFIAPATTVLSIELARPPWSALDGFLTVFDGDGNVIGVSDDFGATRDARVQISVRGGQTYYAQAAGFATSFGAYTLTVTAAAVEAFPVELLGDGLPFTLDPVINGVIEEAGAVDFFRVSGLRSGPIALLLIPVEDSLLDGALTVFDASGEVVAHNDNAGAGVGDVLGFTADAGAAYYAQVTGGASTGAYAVLPIPYAGGRLPFEQSSREAGGGGPGGSFGYSPLFMPPRPVPPKAALVVIPPPVSSGMVGMSSSGVSLSPLNVGGLPSLVLVVTLTGGVTAPAPILGVLPATGPPAFFTWSSAAPSASPAPSLSSPGVGGTGDDRTSLILFQEVWQGFTGVLPSPLGRLAGSAASFLRTALKSLGRTTPPMTDEPPAPPENDGEVSPEPDSGGEEASPPINPDS